MIFRTRAVGASLAIVIVWLGAVTYFGIDSASDDASETEVEKTQDGVDRATRTIRKVKEVNRDVVKLTDRLDRALGELRGNFEELLVLLNALGIDTATIAGGANDADPQPAGSRSGAPDSGGESGGDGRDDDGPGDGGDPPDGEPDPPSDPKDDPPKDPPPEPDPTVGGLGLDVPLADECALAPATCSRQ